MDRWLERLSEEPVLGLVALTIVTLFGLVFVFIFWLVARAPTRRSSCALASTRT